MVDFAAICQNGEVVAYQNDDSNDDVFVLKVEDARRADGETVIVSSSARVGGARGMIRRLASAVRRLGRRLRGDVRRARGCRIA